MFVYTSPRIYGSASERQHHANRRIIRHIVVIEASIVLELDGLPHQMLMRYGYALVALYFRLERLYRLERGHLERERGARQGLDVDVDHVLVYTIHLLSKTRHKNKTLRWTRLPCVA